MNDYLDRVEKELEETTVENPTAMDNSRANTLDQEEPVDREATRETSNRPNQVTYLNLNVNDCY